MSERTLPSFRSIAEPLDVDDTALARVSDGLGVPTLTRPEASKSVELRTPLEKLTIEVPGYLADAVRRAALDRRSTVRHVVLAALRADGFEIAEVDMIADGRRTRRAGA